MADVSNHREQNAADLLLTVGLGHASGDGLAILTDDESISYNQLAAAACRAGNAMRALGVGLGDRVLIMADDRPQFFYAYLGAMKIGAVPVALNLRFSKSNLTYIVADSGCRLILCDDQFVDLFQAALAVGDAPRLVDMDSAFPAMTAEQNDHLPSQPMARDDMAFWMYTSGTTGEPKAVVHLQRSIESIGRYLGPVYGVVPGDRIFCSSKLFFAFSLGHTLMAGLRLGATIVLLGGWPNAAAVAATIERHRPDIVLSVPVLYRTLLQEGLAAGPGFSAVRYFMSAGEHLPKTLFDRWMAATGHPVLQGIGATEALVMFIANGPDDYLAGATGKPLPGTEIRLVSENGETIDGPGLPGVLWVKSDSLASQYWNRQETCEQVFRDGWYVTGDVFFMDEDGFYHYQGRDDDMLKISGQWVSPAEIETHVLENAHVRDAAVIGVTDQSGLVRLVLCLVPKGRKIEQGDLEEELKATLTAELSIYKCPRRFIFLDEMPLTATGKLQRFKLRQMAADYLEFPA